MFRSILALALLFPLTASAVPLELTHQGRLMDTSGVPLTTTEDVTFSIYDVDTGGTAIWTETQSIPFDGGFFSVTLSGFDSDDFDGSKLYLGIIVGSGGTELTPRQEIVSVPYAIRAGTATDLSGGIVDATEIRVNGTTVIDSDGTIDGASLPGGDGDTLGELSCLSNEIAVFDGLDWQCAPNGSTHTHDASDIDNGTLSIDRIPVGGGATQVAAGDHTHSYGFTDIGGAAAIGQLPVGTGSNNVAAGDHSHSYGFTDIGGSAVVSQLPVGTGSNNVAAGDHGHSYNFSDIGGAAVIGQLPVGSTSSDVARGDHAHTAADVGALPDTGGDLSGRLNVAEEVQVGQGSASCSGAGDSGTLRWTGSELQVCDGVAWEVVYGSAPDGSAGDPADDCATLHVDYPALGDGNYFIDPDGGSAANAFQVFCDMTTDGGGWVGLQLGNAGSDFVFYTNPDDGNNAESRSGDQTQYYSNIAGTDSFPDTEFLHNALSTAPSMTTIDIVYNNPATGGTFTTAQLDILRGFVSQLAPSTRLVAMGCDDFNEGGGLGHEAYISDGAGNNMLNLTYGTQPGDEQTAYYLLHTSASLTQEVNVELSQGGTAITALPSDYLIPARTRLGWEPSSNGQWGGGASWGYEEPVFLVK